MTQSPNPPPLHRTPLYALHQRLGARMVSFAGYEMPVQYPDGVLKEHRHTRDKAGLFDVSHMGQAWLTSESTDPAALLEALVPADLISLRPGRQRYALLLTPQGGISDDLMVARCGDDPQRLHLVVNASRKEQDFALIASAIGTAGRLERLDQAALLAIQGPAAVTAVAALFGDAARAQPFMTQQTMMWQGFSCLIGRCGYTGEDGFEISIPAVSAEGLAEALLRAPNVAPVGLGARDTLRLEAGLCLYGADLDETTTPVEADLSWSIGKKRRAAGDFPGAAIIQAQLTHGALRRRVGLLPEGRAPARQGAPIVDASGAEIGVVTSGGFSPTLDRPIAMGYVESAYADVGASVGLRVRGMALPATVAPLPFTPHRYFRG